MFIAMNRFRVKKNSEEAFEKVWLSRDTQLTKVPGFVEFHLLKGPEHEAFRLYSSHTVWQSKAAFEAWTRSEEFRARPQECGPEQAALHRPSAIRGLRGAPDCASGRGLRSPSSGAISSEFNGSRSTPLCPARQTSQLPARSASIQGDPLFTLCGRARTQQAFIHHLGRHARRRTWLTETRLRGWGALSPR
jgi:heme-degrading monooxygenase HmoA